MDNPTWEKETAGAQGLMTAPSLDTPTRPGFRPSPPPSVSVIIPSKNRREMLWSAMQSVDDQTYQDHELFVHRSEGYCVGKINRAALGAAIGKWLVFLCDDDILEPTYLEKLLLAAEGTKAHIAYCDYHLFGMRDEILPAGDWTLEGFRRGNPVHGLTCLIRRDVFRELGGFSEALNFQDWDLWYRVYKAGGRAAVVRQPLVHYRWHLGMAGWSLDHAAEKQVLLDRYPELQG